MALRNGAGRLIRPDSETLARTAAIGLLERYAKFRIYGVWDRLAISPCPTPTKWVTRLRRAFAGPTPKLYEHPQSAPMASDSGRHSRSYRRRSICVEQRFRHLSLRHTARNSFDR